ncbi:MAG: hypothetical protein JXR19_11060 [Bacteroidia bacterium]
MKSFDKFMRKLVKATLEAHPKVETKEGLEELFQTPQTKFENPTQQAVVNQLTSDRISMFNKFWYVIHLIKANGIIDYDPFYNKALKYFIDCRSLIEYKVGGQIHTMVNDELSLNGFKLTKVKREKVHAHIQNIVFVKINEKKLKFEPEIVTTIKDWAKRVLDHNRIRYESILVGLEPEELDKTGKLTLTIGQKHIPMYMNQEILALVKEHHSIHDPFVEYINELTKWGESKSRKEYSNFLLNLSQEMKRSFRVEKVAIEELFELLYKETKSKGKRGNKQKAYDFIHKVLRPFYSELHSKEEHDKVRKHASHDARSYRQHKRDSIDALMY